MNKLNEKLTKLEEQTAELIIEAQELRKEIAKAEDIKQSPMIDKFGRYLSAPEEDMEYFFVRANGDIADMQWEDDSLYDQKALKLGVVFNTRENAERQAKRDKLTQRARVFMHKDQMENGSVDWRNANKRKHCVHIDGVKVFNSEFSGYRCFLAFTSDAIRTQFLEEFTDNEILIILGVE